MILVKYNHHFNVVLNECVVIKVFNLIINENFYPKFEPDQYLFLYFLSFIWETYVSIDFVWRRYYYAGNAVLLISRFALAG